MIRFKCVEMYMLIGHCHCLKLNRVMIHNMINIRIYRLHRIIPIKFDRIVIPICRCSNSKIPSSPGPFYARSETNIAPENRPSKKEMSSSNHGFSGAMLVSGGVSNYISNLSHKHLPWNLIFQGLRSIPNSK